MSVEPLSSQHEERSASAASGEGGRWRLAGALGLAAAFGSVAGVLSPPFDLPSSNAPAEEFARYYTEQRGMLLAICFLGTVAHMLVIPVLAALSDLVRPRSPMLAATGLAAGAITVAMTISGFAVLAALAYRTPGAQFARDGSAVGWMFINLAAGPPTTVAIGAYTWGLARGGQRAWILALGLLVTVAHLVVAAAFAEEGFLSPHGGVAYLVPCLFFAWVAGACVVIWRGARVRGLPGRSPDPA